MSIIELMLGFVLGCISSGLVVLVWYKVFVPKVKFAESICKCKSTSRHNAHTYKIKFRNIGNRDIFEMYLYCILSIPELEIKGSTHTVDINLSYNFKPLFRKRGRKGLLNPDGLVRICLNDEQMMEEFTRSIYSEEINKKATQRLLTLEDILNIKPSSNIRFYIIAHDNFTGSKKLFESKAYTVDDVKYGLYKFGELYVV